MKKLLLLFVPLLLVLGVVGVVYANDDSENKGQQVLPASEVVDNDYFAAGSTVTLSGTVNNDAYLGGGTVTVDGTVKEDLLAAGGTVSVSGDVDGNIRVGGGQITISGTVGGNVTVVGGSAQITSDAVIAGNVVVTSGNMEIAGVVDGNVHMASGNLTVSGTVQESIDGMVGQLHVTSNAIVAGNIDYQSDNDAQIDDGADIGGTVTKTVPPVHKQASGFAGINFAARTVGFLINLVFAVVLVLVLPKFSTRVATTLRQRPWAALACGFATLVLTPITVVLLLITVLGIPLALITAALYGISLYVGKFFVLLWAGTALGERMRDKKFTPLAAILVGTILYSLLRLIPVVGPVVGFLSLLFGLGALMLTVWPAGKKAKKAA